MMLRARRAALWILCSLALAVFVYRVVIPSARNPYTVGFATLYAESRLLIERPRDLRHIYDDAWFQPRIDGFMGRHVHEIAHGQPPTMSLMLLPLAWLGPDMARVAWTALSTLLWVGGLAILARSLQLPPFCDVPPAVWLTALTTIYRPVAENLRRGQGYVLLFFLLTLVVAAVLRYPPRPRWLGGIPLGLMLVLKSAGLWLWPLLALTRQWRLLGGAMLAVVSVVLAGSLVMGTEAWIAYLQDAAHWIASEPSNHVTAYQTLNSLTGHLMVYEATWNPHPIANLPIVARCLTALIVGGALALSIRVHRIGGERIEDRALTIGMFVALVAPVAPIGEGYHYVLVLPALVVAWWWAVRSRATIVSRLVLLAATGLLCAPQRYYSAPVLRDGWAALLAYPLVYGAFGLWAWLFCALRPSSSTALRRQHGRDVEVVHDEMRLRQQCLQVRVARHGALVRIRLRKRLPEHREERLQNRQVRNGHVLVGILHSR
jgi:hypothetical protein